MKQLYISCLQKQKLSFLFFVFLLVFSMAGFVNAGHDKAPTPDEQNKVEHYEGDGHDHGKHFEGDGHDHGTKNKASQLNDEGIALYRAKDYKGALEKFQQAADEAPEIGEVLAMLGKTQVKLEDYGEAAKNLEKSLTLSKNPTVNRLTHKHLARAYIGMQEFEKARKEIDQYKDMCVAQYTLTPKTEKIIKDLYDQLK